MSLGTRIARLRKERRWKQAELAEKLGVHPRHVTRWEHDHLRPRVATLEKLAEAFEVTVQELLGELNNIPPQRRPEDPELARLRRSTTAGRGFAAGHRPGRVSADPPAVA